MTAYDKLSGEFNPTVPTRVIFGQGKTASLGSEVADLGGKRVLVLSGRTVAEQTDAVRRVQEALGGSVVGVYSGLTQRAPLATAVEAANLAVSLEADTLVGVGGSTISDAARMIAVLMAEGIDNVEELRVQGHREDGMLRPNLDGKALPLQVSIPTTLSAGEFNMGGGNVLDDGEGHKIRVGHPRLYADLIVLDPDVTAGTPDWLWLSTGVKALDHCIERLYCRGNQPAIDAPVLSAAEMLFDALPRSRQADGRLGGAAAMPGGGVDVHDGRAQLRGGAVARHRAHRGGEVFGGARVYVVRYAALRDGVQPPGFGGQAGAAGPRGRDTTPPG